MEEIEFAITRFNKFLKNHIFWVEDPYNFGDEGSLGIKIILTGIKRYIVVGEWKDHVTFTIEIVDSTGKLTRYITDSLIGDNEIEINTYEDKISYSFRQKVNNLVSNVLTRFSLDEYPPILTKVVKNFK
jgi:hypothetical protein